jgi:multiple sugar transport system permease protein
MWRGLPLALAFHKEENLTRSRSSTWRTSWYTAGNYLFILPFLAFFLAFTAIPIVTAFAMSLRDWPILAKSHPFVGLKNYQELWADRIWWQALRNTLYFAVLTATGTTVFAFVMAHSVNKPIKGANAYRFIFYTPVVISVAAMGIVMGWTFSTQFGIVNAVIGLFGANPVNWLGDKNLVIPTLSVASIWWGFGAPMLIYLAGLQNIPAQLYEAASIDGATRGQMTRRITLPLMLPNFFFVLVTQLIGHLQVFGQSYLITGGGPGRESYTSVYYLYQTAWRYYRMGYGCAIAIGLALVIMAITAIQFKAAGDKTHIAY